MKVEWNDEMLISDQRLERQREFHRAIMQYGMGGANHAEMVKSIISTFNINSVLDYGAGKQKLGDIVGPRLYSAYDPAVAGIEEMPEPAEMVCVFDVLSIVEHEHIEKVMHHIIELTKRIAIFTVYTAPMPPREMSPGEPLDLIMQGSQFWLQGVMAGFTIDAMRRTQNEVLIVGVK